jgi:hypothetical protein
MNLKITITSNHVLHARLLSLHHIFHNVGVLFVETGEVGPQQLANIIVKMKGFVVIHG